MPIPPQPLHPRRYLRVAAAPLLMVVGLVGCAYPTGGIAPAEQATESIKPATTMGVMTGRLGLQFPDGTQPAVQLGFTLQGDRTQGQLVLETPFGTTVASVQWNAQNAWLTRGDLRQPFASLDLLLSQALGSDLPVDAVFAWLNGQGTRALAESGWVIENDLPQMRLRAFRSSPAPAVRLTLVLDRPT